MSRVRPRGLVVIALAFAMIVSGCTGGGGDGTGGKRADPGAAERVARLSGMLDVAIGNLATSPATRYRGGAGARGVRADIRVTASGKAFGTVWPDGDKAGYLAVGGKTFLKAGRSFWEDRTGKRSAKDYAGTWVRVRPAALGLDPASLLTPRRLAERVRASLPEPSRLAARPESLGERGTWRFATKRGAIWLARAEPYQIVKIVDGASAAMPRQSARPVRPSAPDPVATARAEVRAAAAEAKRAAAEPATAELRPVAAPAEPTPTPDPDAPGVPDGVPADDLDLDLDDVPLDELADLFEDLADRVEELNEARDSTVDFRLNGAANVFCTRGPTSCTVTVNVTNTLTAQYHLAPPAIPVTMQATVTSGGAGGGTCADRRTMRPNSSATLSCRVGMTPVYSRTPRMIPVQARTYTVANAMLRADIRKILDELKDERKKSRDPRTCRPGGFRANPVAGPGPKPAATCSPPPPSAGPTAKPQGGKAQPPPRQRGSEQGGRTLGQRAAELKGQGGDPRATVAAVRVQNVKTGKQETWISSSQPFGSAPAGWKLKPGERYVPKPCLPDLSGTVPHRLSKRTHAEERVIDALCGEWVIVEGGTSYNVCQEGEAPPGDRDENDLPNCMGAIAGQDLTPCPATSRRGIKYKSRVRCFYWDP